MLTQSEADFLINLEKKSATDKEYHFPGVDDTLTIPLLSSDEKELFLLDISRAKINLTKCSYLERVRKAIVLLRLDVNGRPHTNPYAAHLPLNILEDFNGETIGCPHLHFYVEGYMDKWAIPVPENTFTNTNDLYQTLHEFFDYCKVIEPPTVHKGAF